MSHGKLAIIGIGEVPTRINPERTRWDILYDVCMEAIKDSEEGLWRRLVLWELSAPLRAFLPWTTSRTLFGINCFLVFCWAVMVMAMMRRW